MSSITGLNGLSPTLRSIKYTKKILIANKESIICGWNLINNKLKKYKTEFIPVDSEHFSLWYGLQNLDTKSIEKIYITASGGPFKDTPIHMFKSINVKKAIKLDKPPQRCYNPEPEGSSGNMKLPKECVYCRHKFECHSDANDGLGLRVFKYSRGYSYLTQTPRPPKVIEVTNEWQKSKKTS